MKKNILLLFLLTTVSCLHLLGQDPHFSQNVGTPLYVNPAMTGLYSGDMRLGISYRNQWAAVSAPYQTLLVSVDGKLNASNRSKGWISGGIQIMSDQAGIVGLSNNSLEIALATTTNLGDKHYLSIGALGGLNKRDIGYSEAQFGNQFDGFGFAPEINSGEVFEQSGISRFSLGGGVVYYYLEDNRNYWYGGVAGYNLVRSELAFTINEGDVGLNIPVRLSLQAGGSLNIQDKIDLVPSAYFMQQGGHWKTDVGSMFRLIFENNRRQQVFKAISAGPFVRFTNTTANSIGADAFIFAVKLDYDDWAFGLSYDFNLSGLNNATNGKGGTEVNLVYMPQIRSRKIGPTSCPRF